MLDLGSPRWGQLYHAYDQASDLPAWLRRLHNATDENWKSILQEKSSALIHQGDVYPATFAVMPYFYFLADQRGPGLFSEELLIHIGLAAAGAGGVDPDLEDDLDHAWQDTQDDARALMIDRLSQDPVAQHNLPLFFAGIFYLAGEWQKARRLEKWFFGQSISIRCPQCQRPQGIIGPSPVSMTGTPVFPSIVQPTDIRPMPIDADMDFEDEFYPAQLLGLANLTHNALFIERIRFFLGSMTCPNCQTSVAIW